jgi:hypothetical protein
MLENLQNNQIFYSIDFSDKILNNLESNFNAVEIPNTNYRASNTVVRYHNVGSGKLMSHLYG